jgi:cytidylate kinase
MLIALTGLHASGKSYFANNIPVKFGFKVYNKKEIVKYICKEKTGREDWNEWYREEFNKNAYNVTNLILSYINLDENIILDAVHSDLEWRIISSIVPNAELIGIITPDFIRQQRREEGDLEKDEKRIKYWHNGGGCLLTNLSWTINGGASLKINEEMFKEFLQYVQKKQLAIQGKHVIFSDDKNEKLVELIKKNDMLGKKIEQAENLLNECKKIYSIDKEEGFEK